MNNTKQKVELVECNGCGVMINPREANYHIPDDDELGTFVYCDNCVDWEDEEYDRDDADYYSWQDDPGLW